MGKDQEFLEAARNGNSALIEKILNQKTKRSGPLASLRRGPGINVQDNGGYSALHYSALNGHTDIVRLLLFHEASPNLLDSRGSSALHLAAWAGHQEIVKMLLTHPYKPANPDLQTMENETPLHCAAQHGHTGALTTLLAHGADPNVCNSRNETPLDLAAQYGRLQAVQMLIRAHPELLQPYSLEVEPLSSSFVTKSRPTVITHSALHLASRNGHNNIVEILLAAGVNVNLLTPSGTALHEAALCGKELVVRTLLEAGADLNATDSEGRTPLDILREFPPHVTKGIISVINNFRTRYDGDLEERYSFDETYRPADNEISGIVIESASGCLKRTPTKDQLKSNDDVAISPSVSVSSFEQSMTSSTAAILPRARTSNGNLPEFYVKMAPIKLQKPAPKKPPRRNLSISPTHIQNFFPNNELVIELCDNEASISVPESSKNSHKHGSYEYNCTARSGSAMYSSNENLIKLSKTILGTNNSWFVEMARPTEVIPVPAPRKLKNLSQSCENSTLKSYNPNRKLKRNRENYFTKGEFSLTICSENQQLTPNPTPGRDKKSELNEHSRRPLSQEYTFPVDYLEHLSVESGNSPQDNQPLCVSLCNSSGSISSGVSLSDRSVSTDCVEEYVGDEPFAGLFKGSTLKLNNENSHKPNSYYITSEYHQSAALRSRSFGVDEKNLFTSDSQSESSEEPSSNGTTSRKHKKSEYISDDCKSIVKESHAHKPNSSSDNMNITSNRVLTTERKNDFISSFSSPTTTKESAVRDAKDLPTESNVKILSSFNEQEAWQKLSDIMETFGNTILNSESTSNGLNSYSDFDEVDLSEDLQKLTKLLEQSGLSHLQRILYLNGYDSYRFMNGIFDERDLSFMNISGADAHKLLKFIKTLPHVKFTPLVIETSLDCWLKSIQLIEYSDNFKKHLYNTFKSVCGVWEIELQTVLEINKIGHRKRILYSVAHIRQAIDVNKSSDIINKKNCEGTVFNLRGTLRHNKKNRPAPKPPLNSLEIRAPSELLIGLPNNLRIKWPHSASSLVSHFLKYEVYYLGSTVVKELRGTESTRKSIQKLKRVGPSSNSILAHSSKLDSSNYQHEKRSLVQLSISYRGVLFIDIETNGTICEHEIRNINCACQDADDMTHFAYITKDSELNIHYCHVFNVESMHLAMEIILTLAESFEVAYQMALRNTSPLNNKTTESKSN